MQKNGPFTVVVFRFIEAPAHVIHTACTAYTVMGNYFVIAVITVNLQSAAEGAQKVDGALGGSTSAVVEDRNLIQRVKVNPKVASVRSPPHIAAKNRYRRFIGAQVVGFEQAIDMAAVDGLEPKAGAFDQVAEPRHREIDPVLTFEALSLPV